MAKMIAQKVTRYATSEMVRVLEVHKDKTVKVLGTRIEKVMLPDLFVKAHGKTAPIEQYAFKVDGKTVARFADAAALVLKKHHVELTEEAAEASQTYIRKAFDIISGKEPLKMAEATFVQTAV